MKSIALTILLLTMPASQPSARSIAEIMASKKLVVGMSHHDYPPFYSSNHEKTLYGFDIAFAKAIGEALGVEIVFHRDEGGYSRLPQLLNTNQIDVVIAAYRINLDRAKLVRFSRPYQSEKRVFVTLRKNEKNFGKNIAAMQKPSLGTKKFSTGLLEKATCRSFFEKQYLSSSVLLFDKIDPLIDQLRKEKIDFVYVEESVVNHWFDRHHEGILFVSKFFNPEEIDQIAMAVNPNSDHLLDWLNLFIEKQKQDGSLAALGEKYLNNASYKSQRFDHD